MDDRIDVLANTLFKDLLSTIDIYVLHAHLHGLRPTNTVFVVFEDDNSVRVDFDYGEFRASSYMRRPVRDLGPAERRARASEIARELAALDAANEDIPAYVQQSCVLRRLLRVRRSSARMSRVESVFGRAEKAGVDSAFVKDVLYQ